MISEAGARPSAEWTLSGTPLYAAGLGLFLMVVLFGFLLTRVVDLAHRAELADRLGRRNAELEQNMQKVLALEQELAALRNVDREIRSWAGLSPEPRAVPPPGGGRIAGAGADVGAGARADIDPELGAAAVDGALVEPPRLDSRSAGIDPAAVGRANPFAWPAEGWISSEFQELRGGEGPHSGIDIVAASGTLVAAAAAGRVVVSGSDPQYGLLLAIDHGGGLMTLYGHNAALTVRRDEAVTKGQGIGRVGNTGRSTAPHLHFEVRQDGFALDPRLFLTPRVAPARDAAKEAANRAE